MQRKSILFKMSNLRFKNIGLVFHSGSALHVAVFVYWNELQCVF